MSHIVIQVLSMHHMKSPFYKCKVNFNLIALIRNKLQDERKRSTVTNSTFTKKVLNKLRYNSAK